MLKDRLFPSDEKQNREMFKDWMRVTLFHKPIHKNLGIPRKWADHTVQASRDGKQSRLELWSLLRKGWICPFTPSLLQRPPKGWAASTQMGHVVPSHQVRSQETSWPIVCPPTSLSEHKINASCWVSPWLLSLAYICSLLNNVSKYGRLITPPPPGLDSSMPKDPWPHAVERGEPILPALLNTL